VGIGCANSYYSTSTLKVGPGALRFWQPRSLRSLRGRAVLASNVAKMRPVRVRTVKATHPAAFQNWGQPAHNQSTSPRLHRSILKSSNKCRAPPPRTPAQARARPPRCPRTPAAGHLLAALHPSASLPKTSTPTASISSLKRRTF